jgi:16S rRNA (adenine1518-N6/adenine1519-N6)-dimethyltransferase
MMGRASSYCRKVSLTTASLCVLAPYKPLDALSILSKLVVNRPRNRVNSSFFRTSNSATELLGWVHKNGDWEWLDDEDSLAEDESVKDIKIRETGGVVGSNLSKSLLVPKLPSKSFRPNQSLGQNFMNDGNTIQKIIRAFEKDVVEVLESKTRTAEDQNVSRGKDELFLRAVELGPGHGALTGQLISAFGIECLQCFEIDKRCIRVLQDTHPDLRVKQMDVIHVDYYALEKEEGGPVSVIGNLPYYITTQILFSLADASHTGSVTSATVTLQWEVAQRLVAPMNCKDYGILSIVFQLYADCVLHFKIPRTVFYPQPKVDSALVGLRFVGPEKLRNRLCGITPVQLRRVLSCIFQQRRKTLRNSLKALVLDLCSGDAEAAQQILRSTPLPLPTKVVEARKEGDKIALSQELPLHWHTLRPEQLSPGQFIEVTRLVYTRAKKVSEDIFEKSIDKMEPLAFQVWGKLKHGS